MFKELLKAILLLSVVVLGGNLIALCQKVTSTMSGYMMLLTITCMLLILWIQVIKLVKGN